MPSTPTFPARRRAVAGHAADPRPRFRRGVRIRITQPLGGVLTIAVLTGALSPAPLADAADPRPRLSWPLDPEPTVARPFDPPPQRYGQGHRGVDLAARVGQRVLAAEAGVVVHAGPLGGRGVLSIQHDGGLRTTYEPVRPTVEQGARVHRGQAIGAVRPGHPGCPTEACLHWGARMRHEYVNPLVLIRTDVTTRLKPWNGHGRGSATPAPR